MRRQEANAVIDAIGAWAIRRDDIRAMALVGSWARGNPHRASDIDVLLLTDNADEYRPRRTWLCEIDFRSAGYRLHSTKTTFYGVVWSRHVYLRPTAELELTFADCSWAETEPVDEGTRRVVKDAIRIIFDRDGSLARCIHAVKSGYPCRSAIRYVASATFVIGGGLPTGALGTSFAPTMSVRPTRSYSLQTLPSQ